ncbi:ATP-binding protein [soil metagenome]
MIITGLRGVGKTVLLNKFREKAEGKGWAVVEIEVSKHTDNEFRRQLSHQMRQALLAISPKAKWGDRAKAAAGVLRSFSLTFDPSGSVTAGFDVEATEGRGDSGSLDLDLSDLITSVGEAAREHSTGVLLLLDEVQFLTKSQLESLMMALHRAVQRTLPITMVGAGLPQIAELTGEAKSYSERLFTFPMIDRLSDSDSAQALLAPAAEQGVEFDPDAVGVAYQITGGYPFFIQELGYAVWPLADDHRVTMKDIRDAERVFTAKLDSSFFRVRMDRTTELEQAYLRAMAQLGEAPQLAGNVAALLNRSSEQCGPARSTLIEKGLLYTPSHGYAAFTVPHFDRYMMRAVPELVVPALRSRPKRKN